MSLLTCHLGDYAIVTLKQKKNVTVKNDFISLCVIRSQDDKTDKERPFLLWLKWTPFKSFFMCQDFALLLTELEWIKKW